MPPKLLPLLLLLTIITQFVSDSFIIDFSVFGCLLCRVAQLLQASCAPVYCEQIAHNCNYAFVGYRRRNNCNCVRLSVSPYFHVLSPECVDTF